MADFFGQRLQFAKILGMFGGQAERSNQALCRHRLDDVIRSTRPHGLDRAVG